MEMFAVVMLGVVALVLIDQQYRGMARLRRIRSVRADYERDAGRRR